jgi:hypothetical protein
MRWSDSEDLAGCSEQGVSGQRFEFKDEAMIGKNLEFRGGEIDGKDPMRAGFLSGEAGCCCRAMVPIGDVGA